MLAFVGQGVANGPKSQFVKPICDSFGWIRTQFTTGMSIGDATMFLANIFFAVALTKLKGIRNVFLVGALLMCVSYLLFFNVQNLPMLYAGWALFGIAQAYINTAGYSAIVNNWFIKKKGTVFGLIFAGTGVGAMIWNLVVGYAIENHGWRTAFLYSLIAVAVLSSVAITILRNKPADVRLQPYGAETVASDTSKTEEAEKHLRYGFTLKEAMKQPFYWIGGFGLSLLILAVFGVFVNAPGYLGDKGMSAISIASLISSYYIFATIGKIIGGFAIDRFGVKKVLIFCVACLAIGTFMLTTYKAGGSMAPLYAFIVFYGLGFVTTSVPVPMVAQSLFGNRDLPAIMGTFMAFFSFGGMFAGPSGSLAYDFLGSYIPAFYLYVGLGVVALTMIFIAMRMSEKILAARDEERKGSGSHEGNIQS